MTHFPGQELIEVLNNLRIRLNSSGVERTNGLLQELGDDCSYYRKSLDIFLRKDYEEIKDFILRAEFLIQQLD